MKANTAMNFKKAITILPFLLFILSIFSFRHNSTDSYQSYFKQQIDEFKNTQTILANGIKNASLTNNTDIESLRTTIHTTRLNLKTVDFWLRYLEKGLENVWLALQ